MTKEEFVKGYCERSIIDLKLFNKYFVALPCDCGHKHCDGWKVKSNIDHRIRD